jgi:hypothetical protein
VSLSSSNRHETEKSHRGNVFIFTSPEDKVLSILSEGHSKCSPSFTLYSYFRIRRRNKNRHNCAIRDVIVLHLLLQVQRVMTEFRSNANESRRSGLF